MLHVFSLWTSRLHLATPLLTRIPLASHLCKTFDAAKERRVRKVAEEDERLATLIDVLMELLRHRVLRNTPMTDILHSLPDLPPSAVDRLLAWFTQRCLYDCLIVAAVRYNRLGDLLKCTIDEARWLTPILRRLLQTDLLDVLAAEGVEQSWRGMLKSFSKLNRLMLLCGMARVRLSGEGLKAFSILTENTPDKFRIVENQLKSTGFIPQYRAYIFSKKVYKRKSLDHHARFVLEYWFRTRSPEGCPNSANNCMAVLCEAGVFADRHTLHGKFSESFTEALARAVSCNQPDQVKFLYSTGSFSDATVLQLSQDPQLIEKCESSEPHLDPAAPANEFPSSTDVHAAREIRSFLESKASEPRSLKTLCLTHVSRGLGLGLARRKAVNRLPIPPTLKQDLLTNCDTSLLKYSNRCQKILCPVHAILYVHDM